MMNNHNENELTIIALCTNLGNIKSDFNPLTNLQYHNLANNIFNSSLKTPENLLNNIHRIEQIAVELSFSEEDVIRIRYLLSPERILRVHMAIHDLKRKNIFILTRANERYPNIFKTKLKEKRPPVLFYIGNLDLLNERIVGIVGSRDIAVEEESFIEEITSKYISEGFTIVSGGAKGSDRIAEESVIEKGGNLILVLSSELNKKIQNSKIIQCIIENRVLILSESIPSERFKIFSAMARNKYIYALSEKVFIAKTDYNKGGTWAGAQEALKNNYTNVVVKNNHSDGFKALIKLGATIYGCEEEEAKKPELEKTNEQLSLF